MNSRDASRDQDRKDRLTPEGSLAIALDYIAQFPNHYIFPIAPGRKDRPRIKDNLNRASNDAKQIEAWAKKFPGANWGLAPGLSGIIPVDVDTKAGKVGQETFLDLEMLYDKFPPTYEVRTPTGGRHHYYYGKPVFAIGKAGFGEDIDCPQYVLIPGCRTADGEYTLVSFDDIAPAPEWFELVLKNAREKKAAPKIASTEGSAVELDKPENVEWAKLFLAEDAEPAIAGKNGNTQTWKIAAQLRGKAVSQPMAFDLMLEFYNPRCDPPWDADELERLVANGYNYASKERIGEKTPQAEFGDDDAREIEAAIKPFGEPEVIAAQAIQRAQDKVKGTRPQVVFDVADLPAITRKVQALVIESAGKPGAKPADQIFQRAGKLVHLSRNQLKPDSKKDYDRQFHVANDLLIKASEPGWLADRLERGIAFGRIGKKKGASGKSEPGFIATKCPADILQRLASIPQEWEYPQLVGTIEAPTLRADGTILDVPGYDARSGLYYDPGLTTFPAIKDRPTKADARKALEVLKEPIADFPFGDEDGVKGLSRSVALACMLTGVCRRTLPIAPMFGIDSNNAESGKTELAQVVAIMMTGRRTAVRPLSADEYQRSGALAAALSAGDPVILYDNVNGDEVAIEGNALCMAVTDEVFKSRRLGGNSAEDQIEAPTNALMIATGNKLTAAGDMAESRMLMSHLRPDKPLAERTYSHWPLDEYVMSVRAELVVAALTILRAYAIADDKKPGAYFRHGKWREMVADALVWLGEPDPVLSVARVKANDPVREAQSDVTRAWVRILGTDGAADVGHTTAEVLKHDDIKKAIADARDEPLARLTIKGAANYLKGMTGVDLLGYKLAHYTDKNDKMKRWRMVPGPGAVPIEREPLRVRPVAGAKADEREPSAADDFDADFGLGL